MQLEKALERKDLLYTRMNALNKVISRLGCDRDFLDEKRVVEDILEEYNTEYSILKSSIEAVDIDVPITPVFAMPIDEPIQTPV
jgi:hypothetical protein